MYGVESANLSFNKKSYVYALLQKLQFKGHASERVILKNMLQKGYIVKQRVTHNTAMATNQLCKYVTKRHVENVSSNKQTMNSNQISFL